MGFRLQTQINDEMLKKIDFYCQKMCVSRSNLCSMLIAQGLAGLDKAFSLMDDVGAQLIEQVKKEKENEPN